MGFSDFIGNETAVRHLREAIAAGRLPHSLLMAGPRGAGKYTLAVMLAQAVNCLEQPVTGGLPDFCGHCSNCERIGQALDLETRVAEAIAAREDLREVDKKETRILVQTHPSVLVIPPDPPQLLIKMGQVRQVIREAQRTPSDARRAVFIFTSASFMKEAANSLLKVLEEPPPYALIVLTAENPGELLPTIRSRTSLVRLGAIAIEEIEPLLASRRSDLKPRERALVARLAEGAVGRALGFDLPGYLSSRADALVLMRNALQDPDHTALFKVTETYRAGAEGQEKTQGLIRAMRSLLEDLLILLSGASGLIRNVDLERELGVMAGMVTLDWLDRASRGLQAVESGMRRNLLRNVSLDAFAAELEGAGR
ncbi:MAG: ATP-binding protein [Acidobacteriaceae bacterium]